MSRATAVRLLSRGKSGASYPHPSPSHTTTSEFESNIWRELLAATMSPTPSRSSNASESTGPGVVEERVADSSEHGRGQQGRGRGRGGRGRGGRGRGGGRGGPAGFGGGYANFQAGPIYPPPNTALYPPRTPYREFQAPRPRLTHCACLYHFPLLSPSDSQSLGMQSSPSRSYVIASTFVKSYPTH